MSSEQKTSVTRKFKLAVLGPVSSGKTTYIKRLSTGEFLSGPLHTLGCEETKLSFYCKGAEGTFTVEFNVAEVGGAVPMPDMYYYGLDGAIAMFDVTDQTTYDKMPDYIKGLRRVAEKIPLVICGNKVDCRNRAVKPRNITIHREHKCQYYDISSKSNYNFEKPWLYLARKLTGDETLVFTEEPASEFDDLPSYEELAGEDI